MSGRPCNKLLHSARARNCLRRVCVAYALGPSHISIPCSHPATTLVVFCQPPNVHCLAMLTTHTMVGLQHRAGQRAAEHFGALVAASNASTVPMQSSYLELLSVVSMSTVHKASSGSSYSVTAVSSMPSLLMLQAMEAATQASPQTPSTA